MSLKSLRFYFDPISPYAALAFERLPQALEGCSYEVEYRPVLLAGILHALSNKGPAEIASKREWTYRQVRWLAHQMEIPLDLPMQHPFNPLPLLRMAWACAAEGHAPNRQVVETIMRYVWQSGGADANDPQRLQALRAQLPIRVNPDDEAIKECLRSATEEALQRGVFGVPTVEVYGKLFWGLDALPMLAAYLKQEPWFSSGAWEEAGRARPGLVRKH